MSEAVLPPVLAVARSICWGTHEEADRLGVAGAGTRHWAYRWIEEHVKHLAPIGIAADLGGGGVDSVLCGRLSPHVREMLVVDKFSMGRRKGNIRETAIDLEEGLTGIKDATVDLFVTASSLEHLTAKGQRRVFAEVERALRPGGIFCGTVSYITRLDSRAIQLIQSDPVFEQIGSMVHARFDLCACLQSASRLQPLFPPPDWSAFPGFDGFEESRLLESAAFISGQVGSYGQVRCLPDVDALQLKWFELALFLRKSA